MISMKLRLAMCLTLGAVATAQSPLTTTFAANNGQAGNMFDLRPLTHIAIDTFDVNLNSCTFDIEVWTSNAGSFIGVQQDASQWTLVASFPGVVSAGPDVPTPLGGCLNLALAANTTQGFYVTTTGGGMRYTTNGAPWGTLYTANAELEFYAGSGNVYPFGSAFGGTSTSRVWNGNIYYTLGSQSGCVGQAEKSTYGVGCYDLAASFYEVMSPTAMDLGGMKVTGTATASGYDITTAASAWTGPGLTATAMALGDDDLSLIHIPSPRDQRGSRMPSSA